MGKILLFMALIFIGIYFLVVITPKLAVFIDKHSGKTSGSDNESPERVQEENYTVHDIYEGTMFKEEEKETSADKDKEEI